MRFYLTAQAFAELERTASRRRMVELVAELFQAADRWRCRLAYLLQRATPASVRGRGDRSRRTASDPPRSRVSYGRSGAAISRRLGRLGDLGLVAAALAPPREGDASPSIKHTTRCWLWPVRVVRARSNGRPTAGGPAGPRDPLEARFLVRIAQGRLRLGVGDQTITRGSGAGGAGRPETEAAPGACVQRALRPRWRGATRIREGSAGLAAVAPKPAFRSAPRWHSGSRRPSRSSLG
jgi:hypothetical protein